MRILLFILLALLATAGLACQDATGTGSARPEPPVAKKSPTKLEKHGHVRVDDYYWLKEREDPEVVAYLEAENTYTKTVMGHTEKLRQELYDEMVGRIKQDDASVPYRLDGYYYYTRFEEGQEYPIYCRKKGSLEADEQVMLDVNQLAQGHEFFNVRSPQVSSGGELLAFASDNVGRRIYTIHFKNLTTGEALEDQIPEVTGGLAWANDNKTLFYAKQDSETLRSFQIYRHALGTSPSADVLVYEEQDPEFSTYVWKSKSKKYIMIGSFQTESSEQRYVDANSPADEFKVFLPREPKHEYRVDHYGDTFFVRTNHQAKNFKLIKTPVEQTSKKNWTDVIPAREDVLFEGFEIFRDYLVLQERKDGLIQLRVRPWSGKQEHYLDFGEPTYLAYIGQNPEIDTGVLRYGYTSLTTPRSVYDYDMASGDKKLMKQDEVLGGFDSANYQAERLHATADDGTRVPISVVYRTGTALDGNSPLLLTGYGSYGYSRDATFSSSRLSLLDRGFVFAIAHIRGGEELGRAWYEDGKLLNKKNTFTDFIDSGEFLVENKYADPDRIYAYGGSAGGLLMGAVVNMRPDLFRGVVAAVPFVDVVTTMLDDSIPLTTSEYDEWGDPNDKTFYDYILSYSPYDNVGAKNYPNLLVTTGLHDSQVQYWEPAKWVAKLRATKTDENLLLLKTNMEAGHGGASGRFKQYEEIAFDFAFLLDLAGTPR